MQCVWARGIQTVLGGGYCVACLPCCARCCCAMRSSSIADALVGSPSRGSATACRAAAATALRRWLAFAAAPSHHAAPVMPLLPGMPAASLLVAQAPCSVLPIPALPTRAVTAAAVLLVARKSRGLAPYWPAALTSLTGYSGASTVLLAAWGWCLKLLVSRERLPASGQARPDQCACLCIQSGRTYVLRPSS